MLHIIHGDDLISSRNALHELKRSFSGKDIRIVDSASVSEDRLLQAFESRSMFGGDTAVICEQILTVAGRGEKRVLRIADIVNHSMESTDIVLWEPKILTAPMLKRFPKATVRLYKIPPVIFEFLDSVAPKPSTVQLILANKTLSSLAPELVYYQLAGRMRQLIQAKENALPSDMHPWQRTRLTNQAKSFTMERLLAMHTRLIQAEYSFKTGSSPYTVAQLVIRSICFM